MRPMSVFLALAGSFVSAGGSCLAQDLERRIEQGPDGRVGISFAARPDVCGGGTWFLGIGSSDFGEPGWIWSRGAGSMGPGCEPGPVRALLTRAQGRVVAIRLAVGRVEWPTGTTDLGLVPAGSAGRYFLGLAARVDGRLGRDLLTGAAVADSTEIWPGLVALAKNREVSRGLRESATGWLGREASAADPGSAGPLAAALRGLAADSEAPLSVRTRAVSALGRIEGTGVADLVALARADDPALARPAIAALGRSADPAARAAVRRAASDSAGPGPVRLEALRALGSRDATPADLALLRRLWDGLGPVEQKGAVIELIAEAGGGENRQWLLDLARSSSEPPEVRSRAVRGAEKAGAGSAELVRLYDDVADRRIRRTIIDLLIRIGDRAGRTRVMRIAESDTDPALRRFALERLGRAGDPEALNVLQKVVERP